MYCFLILGVHEVNNDIYIAQKYICMATQKGSSMMVQLNNDIETNLDGDMALEKK